MKYSDPEVGDLYLEAGPGRAPALAAVDVRRALHELPETFRHAATDVEQRYRRSVLGPLWLVLGTAAWATGFSVLGSLVFDVNIEFFLLYVLSGIVAWQFVSSCLNEATGMYAAAAASITAHRVSFSSFAVRTVARQVLVMAHSMPIVALLVGWTGRASWETLWFVPAFAAVCLSLVPIVLVVGLWAARMRDVGQLVNVSLQFIVYLTPVFWLASAIPETSSARLLLELNPFHHMVALIREPLLGDPPAASHWRAIAVVGAAAWATAAVVFPSARGRIVYWL